MVLLEQSALTWGAGASIRTGRLWGPAWLTGTTPGPGTATTWTGTGWHWPGPSSLTWLWPPSAACPHGPASTHPCDAEGLSVVEVLGPLPGSLESGDSRGTDVTDEVEGWDEAHHPASVRSTRADLSHGADALGRSRTVVKLPGHYQTSSTPTLRAAPCQPETPPERA